MAATRYEFLVLTALGFGMVTAFMYLIMSRRLSPLVALITVPTAFALLGGFAGRLPPMMLDGIRQLAPTGVMLMFAILYFGVMNYAGLFEPLVQRIVRLAQGDPLRVVLGTAALALFVSLDGDGSTTYMITVSAVLPLYRRLRMSALALTCVTLLASGVMNLLPWGGPTARAASALHVDPAALFVPMLPALLAGALGVLAVAYHLGLRERRRLGRLPLEAPPPDSAGPLDPRRARLLWFNAGLTAALLGALIAGLLPLPALFMLAFAVALVVNHPRLEAQRRCLAGHAANVLAVVSLIFAAGLFTGILTGTGMVEAMSRGLLAALPRALGPHLAVVTALLSLPFTFFLSNDAFYFGVLPILAEAARAHGISPVAIARASLIGQPVHLLSPLVPSTYLLVGLAGVELADHQRYTLRWAVLICLVVLAAALLCAQFPS